MGKNGACSPQRTWLELERTAENLDRALDVEREASGEGVQGREPSTVGLVTGVKS